MKIFRQTEPPTIARLKKIQPGGRVRYYRGRLSDLVDTDSTTSRHTQLLRAVFDLAKKLADAGRVELIKETTDSEDGNVDFVAVGIEHLEVAR